MPVKMSVPFQVYLPLVTMLVCEFENPELPHCHTPVPFLTQYPAMFGVRITSCPANPYVTVEPRMTVSPQLNSGATPVNPEPNRPKPLVTELPPCELSRRKTLT